MYSFFVLGQVPGTGIVISFAMWVELAALFVMVGLLTYSIMHRRRAAHIQSYKMLEHEALTALQPLRDLNA